MFFATMKNIAMVSPFAMIVVSPEPLLLERCQRSNKPKPKPKQQHQESTRSKSKKNIPTTSSPSPKNNHTNNRGLAMMARGDSSHKKKKGVDSSSNKKMFPSFRAIKSRIYKRRTTVHQRQCSAMYPPNHRLSHNNCGDTSTKLEEFFQGRPAAEAILDNKNKNHVHTPGAPRGRIISTARSNSSSSSSFHSSDLLFRSVPEFIFIVKEEDDDDSIPAIQQQKIFHSLKKTDLVKEDCLENSKAAFGLSSISIFSKQQEGTDDETTSGFITKNTGITTNSRRTVVAASA